MSGWILDGIDLPVVDVTDSFSAAVEKRSYPFKNAQELSFLGVDDRTIKINALFFGARYDEVKGFLRVIFLAGVEFHTLVHPVFGALTGLVQSASSSYNEEKRKVSITLDFVVSGYGDESFAAATVPASIRSTAEQLYADGQDDLKDGFAEAMTESIGSEAGDLIEAEIDESQTLLEQFTTASETAREYLGKVDDAITICEDAFAGVEAPASSFVATIEYGSTLPARFIKAVADALDRTATAQGDLSPRNYLESLKSAYAAFAARFSNSDFDARDQVDRAIAQRYAMDTAVVYDSDNTNSLALKNIEGETSFTVAGKRVVTENAPEIMTIIDLEETLYAARELLQDAVDSDRQHASTYKSLALSLLQHVEAVRLERERIVTVTLTSEMPLHAVCAKYGMPVGYADRLLAINPGIKNPSFVKGEIRIYA